MAARRIVDDESWDESQSDDNAENAQGNSLVDKNLSLDESIISDYTGTEDEEEEEAEAGSCDERVGSNDEKDGGSSDDDDRVVGKDVHKSSSQNDTSSQKVPRCSKQNSETAITQDEIVDKYFTEQQQASSEPKHIITRSLPKMDRKTMNQVLADSPNPFQSSTTALHDMYKSLHNYWLVQLSQGFNILLYGYGSKQKVISDFCKANLSKSYYLVVNGFFPGLTVKQIFNEITSELLQHSGAFKTLTHQCKFICNELCGNGEAPDELFLIIHNIDGTALREEKAQTALSLLATCPRIRIIASVDHLNAPLLWDEIITSRYNWIWHDATTFERYTAETSYENSLLIKQSSSLAMSSLTHVLKSLPDKAQKIFELMATYHLERKDEPSYSGMTFSELYRKCREGFLANSDTTLRAQLTEFLDHKLIKSSKRADGAETLTVLVQQSVLEKFIDQK